MNAAQAGDLVENLSQEIRLRFFRKHFHRLFHESDENVWCDRIRGFRTALGDTPLWNIWYATA